MHPIS
jgi:hypothetical protein